MLIHPLYLLTSTGSPPTVACVAIARIITDARPMGASAAAVGDLEARARNAREAASI
jgi:hypothetical protein